MRLWSQQVLPVLCEKHILEQHQTCCVLREERWDKDHEPVQYALDKSKNRLVAYHFLVIDYGEENYGIDFGDKWRQTDDLPNQTGVAAYYGQASDGELIYPEHDTNFTLADLEDLRKISESNNQRCRCNVSELRELMFEVKPDITIRPV